MEVLSIEFLLEKPYRSFVASSHKPAFTYRSGLSLRLLRLRMKAQAMTAPARLALLLPFQFYGKLGHMLTLMTSNIQFAGIGLAGAIGAGNG